MEDAVRAMEEMLDRKLEALEQRQREHWKQALANILEALEQQRTAGALTTQEANAIANRAVRQIHHNVKQVREEGEKMQDINMQYIDGSLGLMQGQLKAMLEALHELSARVARMEQR